jgi:hypothetical protein
MLDGIIDLTTKNYIFIYTTLVLISIIYLYYYRQKLVRQVAEHTKRNQAIEKFQTYTRVVTNKGNKNNVINATREGFKSDKGARLPSDSKSSALGSKCIPGNSGQASVVPDMPVIPNDEFLIPDLSEQIHARVNKETLKRGQDLIINNIVIAFTKDVIAQSADTYADIQKIIKAATPATEFTQEERLELYFNSLDRMIDALTRSKLETRLTTAFEQSQILTTNESQVRQQIMREIKERVFARLYQDASRLQGELCRTQSELAQKIESASAGEIRFKLQTAQIQHRQTLQSLIRLTETPATQEAIRGELAKLADTVIQPAMETDLDIINSRRFGRMGMSLSESGGESGSASGGEPGNLAAQLGQIPSANAYKDYLQAAARKESEFKIDPIAALDKMEKSTIGFLEQLGVELGMTQGEVGQLLSPKSAKYSTDQANTTLSPPSTNRFSSGQSNNRGSWMETQKQKQKAGNNRSPTREGFATTEKTNQPSASAEAEADLGTQITGWSRYVYDFIKSNFDSEITARAERILTDENNLVPIGILLILGSVLLYFIDLSS